MFSHVMSLSFAGNQQPTYNTCQQQDADCLEGEQVAELVTAEKVLADGADVYFYRLYICCSQELMFQCDEQHNDGTDYGGCDTWQEAASFQLFCAVAFTTGQQYGEHIKDYDTTGIYRQLYRA